MTSQPSLGQTEVGRFDGKGVGSRKRYAKKKVFNKECSYCGTPFQTLRYDKKCCSIPCSKKQRKLTLWGPTPTHICKGCGETFSRWSNSKDKCEYCSRKCAYEHFHDWAKVGLGEPRPPKSCKVYFVHCVICNKLFTKHIKSKQPTCSNECRLQYARDWFHKNWKSVRETNPFVVKICRECGELFRINYRANRTSFCSFKCARKSGKRVRRAHEKNQFVCHVAMNDIYLRDGGKCQICGKRVDRKLIPPNMMSATLDHIIPLSKGGLHEPNNIQLAHFICNSKKSDQMIGQMRLAV